MIKYTDLGKIKKVEEFIEFINAKGALASKNITLAPNDKIYVYKSCKFKRTPLNKLIKEGKISGVKREYDIEKATVIVMPDVTYNNYFRASKMYLVEEVTWIDANSFGSYVYNNQKYRAKIAKKHGSIRWRWRLPDGWTDDFTYLIEDIAIEVSSNYSGIEASHIDLMLKPNVKVVHEDSVQQIVFNINNPTKEHLAEYNFEAIEALLTSSDTANHIIATEVIKNTNIEEDYYKFLSLYHSGRMSSDAKQRIYTNIIKLNPKLKQMLPYWKWNTINRRTELQNFIEHLKKLGTELDPLIVFDDYFGNYTDVITPENIILPNLYSVKCLLALCKKLEIEIDPLILMDKIFNLQKETGNEEETHERTSEEEIPKKSNETT